MPLLSLCIFGRGALPLLYYTTTATTTTNNNNNNDNNNNNNTNHNYPINIELRTRYVEINMK
jgi:hypothetical protein